MTREEIAHKQRQKQLIVGVVLIGLMVVSTAGYSLTRSSGGRTRNNSKVVENGRAFYRQNGIWTTSIGDKAFGFHYLPSEVSNISVKDFHSLGDYADQKMYYTDASSGVIEILNNLGNYALRYQEACLNESDCDGDFPVKDCSSNIFVSLQGNETEVYSDGDCVYLVGDSLRAADAFLYKVLKI